MKLETTTKMASTVELMHLCRLCLVKEQVNVPIFEDHERDSQIFLKIVTCLPVKINKDDKLPKNICGGCSYKLDLFYQFCNSTTNAEKQLLQWFNKVGFADVDNVDNQVEAPKDIVDEAQVDSMSTETQSYILQQQQLPYGPVEFFQGDFDDSQPASVASESEIIEETVSKKRKHPTNNVPNKKSKRVVTTKTEGSDDEDDDANDTNVIPFEDSKFSLSCERDGEQAGPSGIGKADATYSDEAKSVLVSVVALEEKAEEETKKLSSGDVGKKVTAKSRKAREAPRAKRKTRSVKKDEDFEYVPGDGDSSKTEEDEPIHCDTCDTIFKNHLTFGLHSLIHNADEKYSCHMCNYKSSSKYNFEMHIKAHQGKTGYKCEICNKAFTISTHAVEHKNFHTGEKPFQCEICGKHFMFSWFLTSHRRSQHWEIMTGKPLVKYDCTICNKHYTSATGLRRHKISKHNYQGIDASVLCDICGKSLSSKEKLKFHRRIHTGYKPYSCQMCSKSFTRKEQLKEHERVHTGEKPFICKFCGKGFTQRSPLRIHERTHTGERPYICRLCSKGFISKGVMDTHMKNCEGGQHSTFMQ